jgi:DNA-binding CsgD family transcriptional regulator
MTAEKREEILAKYRGHAERFSLVASGRASADATASTAPTEQPTGPVVGRQHDVLALISAGLTDLEIAGRLFLSEHTVKSHVKRLLANLGARNRAHAVAIAFRCCLLDSGLPLSA